MAQVRTGKKLLLHNAQRAGTHALSKGKTFWKVLEEHKAVTAVGFIVGVISLVLTIWGIFFVNVTPQVAAVVNPATAAIQAEEDKNTREILDRLNIQFAAQAPTVTPPPPAISKSVPPLSLHTQDLLPPAHTMVTPAHPLPAAPANPPPAATLPPVTSVGAIVPVMRPKPSHQAHPELTRETPIVIESTWSDDDSTTVANSLRDDLRGDLFTVIDDQYGAAIFIKVEDVVEPPCSDASSCTLSVHVIGQYADGWKFFDEYFHGNESETTLVSYGYDQARNEALTKAYNYLVSITKN